MVDKSDPVDEVSSAGRLYEQIRDTIQEEQVETEDVPAMTPLPEAVEQLKQRQSRFRSNFDRVCGDKALQKMRMRSMSFQEPIKEVNEEYAAAHEILDRSFHTFRLKKAKPIRSVKSVYSAEPIEEEDFKCDSY